MGKRAPRTDFLISFTFDLLSSNSKDPSNTINISPTVPRMGKIEEKSGRLKSRKFVICLTTHPKSNNKNTEGIFVLEEVRSNKYAIKSSTQIVIITVIVIIGHLS